MITAIAISGKICSGKTTLANSIIQTDNRFRITPVAASIKEAVYKAVESREGDNKDDFRKAYQVIGNLGRKMHGETFWANKLIRSCQINGHNFIVVDDVRIPEELETIVAMVDKAFTIRLEITPELQQEFHIAKYGTPLAEDKRLDYTETALDNYDNWDLDIPSGVNMDMIIQTVWRVLWEKRIVR